MPKHRIVIVGGGFGGLAAARRLNRVDADILVVDRVNHHLFQPLLYQVATALLPAGDIAPALRSVLSHQANTQVLLGEVTGIDAAGKQIDVTMADGSDQRIPYDTLVVAAGAVDSYFGHDEWAHAAPPMKTLEQAVNLRSRLLRAFEVAASTTDRAEREPWLTIAIVGAGPTGVELAGTVSDMARRALRGHFRHLEPTEVRIVLLDAAPSVLPPFDEPSREHARRKLEQLGVEVRLDEMVQDIDEHGVTTKQGRIPARTVVWAAGVRSAPLCERLAEATGAPTDRKGRLIVRPDCTVPGHPEIFAIGDMVNLNDLPGIAEPAIQEGHHVAKVIRARLAGAPPPGPFRYWDLGTMATISPGDAVADVRRLHLHGFIGKVAWAVVHLAFLVGWRNRLSVLAGWAWTVTTGRRPQSIILEPVEKRRA